MRAPTGSANQTQLDTAVAKTIRKLGKEVLHVKYTFDDDWTGEPSIYFKILLSDAASREDRLLGVANRITTIIDDELRLYENWGLRSYFSFRSKSEQAKLNDPQWA